MEYIIRNRAHRRNRYFRLLGRKERFQNQINFPHPPEATICSTVFYGRQRASHCQKRVLASFTAKMTRGSTTSIKDKVLPFFVSCLLWLCWHTLFRHREGTSACCSWFSLCDRPRLPSPSVPQIVPFPLQGMARSIPFHSGRGRHIA